MCRVAGYKGGTQLFFKSASHCVQFASKCLLSMKSDRLTGETRDLGVPIHEEEKKFKRRIYIIIPIFPPPIHFIRQTHVGVEGVTYAVPYLLPSKLSISSTPKWPEVGS